MKGRDYHRLVGSREWAALAARLKAGAHYTCQQCGIVTNRLEVHHIRPVESARTYEQMRLLCFDTANCQVLCRACHHAVHERGKRNARIQEREGERVERFVNRWVKCGGIGGEGEIERGLHFCGAPR
ncbi:MAG: HNH endonuclease, partial [Prevotellaceae bacterium]|nr:HNH endonuclease [Prevotellaceae bacterium]